MERDDETRAMGRSPQEHKDTEVMLSPFAELSDGGSTHIDGRYRLLSLLGKGGGGNVYRVHDEMLDEIVALKTLHSPTPDDSNLEHFKQEVKLARKVTHPNVTRVYDLGQEGDRLFLTMEYIDGYSLSQVFRRRKKLPAPEALAIALQLCSGLEAAHKARVIHRDIKPANVLIDEEGRVALSDFGIARLHAHNNLERYRDEEGIMIGTPNYMAPEQLDGQVDIDHRADIYALGVVLFELFSGKRMWKAKSMGNLLHRRLTEEPQRLKDAAPELPESLSEIVARCLARDVEARYDDVSQIKHLLQLLPIQPQMTAFGMGDAQTSSPPLSGIDASPTGDFSFRSHPAARQTFHHGRDKKVAVLPLRARGEAGAQSWTEGFLEDMIDLLSMSPWIQVSPKAVVASMAGQEDPRAVGQQLGVDAVLSGSYRVLADERVQLTLRLHSVRDGFQLCARRIEGTPSDFFCALETWIRETADSLTFKYQENNYITTTDPIAIELYYKARQSLRQHWYRFKELNGTLKLFHEALLRAPRDPIILSFAAVAHARRSYFQPALDRDQHRIAWDLVLRALELAPQRGEPHFAEAMLRFSEGDTPKVIESLQKAVELSPMFADAYEFTGRIVLECGPLEHAIEWLERAKAMDPGLLHLRWDLMRAYALVGRWEEVEALGALEVDAQHVAQRAFNILRTDLWRTEPPCRTGLLPEGFVPQGELEEGLAKFIEFYFESQRLGRLSDDARLWMSQMPYEARYNDKIASMSSQVAAEVELYWGDLDAFFEWMERCLQLGFTDLVWLDHCPLLIPYHSDPRFQSLRERTYENIYGARVPGY